jgi:hypothetical protein
MNWLLSLLLTIIGGLLASLVGIIVWDKFKQPSLIIEIPTDNEPRIQTLPDGKTKRAFYHLIVRNRGRSPAYYCKIFMRFFDGKGEKLAINDVVNGKWDRGPEPIIESPVPTRVNQDGSVVSQLMETRQGFLVPFAEVLDVYNNVPGEGFCPLIKYDNESECYAFGGWSYLKGGAPGHKVPEWKLDKGKYLLEVELVFAGKRSHKERFLIENETTKADGIKLEKMKGSGSVRQLSKKLDEPELGPISNEDVKKITKLLKFIAQGGLYGGLLAILSIGVASLYAGWMGMAVVMLLFGVILFWFGSKQLIGILNPTKEKIRIARKEMLWPVGFFFGAIALMGLIDVTVGNRIPRPRPDPYWWVEGIVGAGLLVIAVLLRVRAKQK